MDIFEDAKSDGEREVQAAQLFVLAEKYGVETVMLNIGMELHAYSEGRSRVRRDYIWERLPPERRAVEIAYKYTYRDSILRKVYLDWYSVCPVGDVRGLRDWLFTVPEFAVNLCVTTARDQKYFYKNGNEYLLRLTGKGYNEL